MNDAIQAFLILIGLTFTVGCCGAAFTFGVCLVSRWMAWAPININVNYYRDN